MQSKDSMIIIPPNFLLSNLTHPRARSLQAVTALLWAEQVSEELTDQMSGSGPLPCSPGYAGSLGMQGPDHLKEMQEPFCMDVASGIEMYIC